MSQENPFLSPEAEQSQPKKRKTGLFLAAVVLFLMGLLVMAALFTGTTTRTVPLTVPVQPAANPVQP